MKDGGVFTANSIAKTAVVLCHAAGAAALTSGGRRLVLLVRHGQTDWNTERRLQGRESVPLNECGRRQAAECAEMFRRAVDAGLVSRRCYTSPLDRAYDTAAIVARSLGAAAPTVVEGLIERDYGELSGLTTEERREVYKNGGPDPEGEPVEEVAKRVKKALVTIASDGEDGEVVAVTHGGVINALFYVITGGRYGTGNNISENCGVSIVAVGRDATFPVAYGLTGESFVSYVAEYRAALGRLGH